MVFDVVVAPVHLGSTPGRVVVEVGASIKEFSFVDEGKGAMASGSRLGLSNRTRLCCNCKNETVINLGQR
jgi:hypothetical protein